MTPAEQYYNAKSWGEIRRLVAEAGIAFSARAKKAELIQQLIQIKGTEIPSPPHPVEIERKEEQKQEIKAPEPVEKPIEVACTQEEILAALDSHLQRGMQIRFTEWGWKIRHNNREDSGTYKMPLRIIERCADNVVRPTVAPNLDKGLD